MSNISMDLNIEYLTYNKISAILLNLTIEHILNIMLSIKRSKKNKKIIILIMKIKPLSDHIVIEPISQEEKTKTGIFLPQTAEKEKPEQGKVIAVGSGRRLSSGKIMPLEIKVGDVILFTKYGPNEIKVGEKEYLIAKQEDILAILE